MGKMITVCSPCPRTGKSVLTFALSNYLNEILDKSIKILVCSANMNAGNVLDLFKIKSLDIFLEDLVNARYSGDKDIELGKILAGNGRMSFLGSKRVNAFFTDRQQQGYQLLIEEMKNQFDVVIVEATSDECMLSYIYKLNSDCIINVLSQDIEILSEVNRSILDKAYNVSIINMYQDIYPQKKDVSKLANSQKVFTSPYCRILQEMKNKGNLSLYLQHETEFIKKAKEMADHLIQQCQLPINDAGNSKDSRNLFLGRFIGGKGK